jgi:hypothetical protein
MTRRPLTEDTEPCLRFHALFLDTQLEIVCPPALSRLLTGRRRGAAPPVPDPVPRRARTGGRA